MKFEKTLKIRNKLLDKEVKRIMEDLGLLNKSSSKVVEFPKKVEDENKA